jgi:hypothetical protein
MLGGRVAEALALGDISTGASNDLQRAPSRPKVTTSSLPAVLLSSWQKTEWKTPAYTGKAVFEMLHRKRQSIILRFESREKRAVRRLLKTDKLHYMHTLTVHLLPNLCKPELHQFSFLQAARPIVLHLYLQLLYSP